MSCLNDTKCANNATCFVKNQTATCRCVSGFYGDGINVCRQQQQAFGKWFVQFEFFMLALRSCEQV
jgi:EGF-like domain.